MTRSQGSGVFAALLVASLAGAGCGDGGGAPDTVADSVPVVENSATGAVDLDTAWSATVESRIGTRTGGGPESFGHVVDLAMDALGRIWVLDRQASEMRVFGPDGGFVRRVGGQGRGPGEFVDPIGVDPGPDGNVWVLDVGSDRITVFDTAGEHLRQYRRLTGGRSGYNLSWRGGFDAEGRCWDVFPTGPGEWAWIVARTDSTLVAVDTMPVPERAEGRAYFEFAVDGGRARYSVPYTPAASWDRTREGVRVMSPGSPYELRWIGPDGETLRIARKSWDPVPLSEEDRKQARKRLARIRKQGGDPDPSRVPGHRPAVQSLFIEPSGRVWIDPHQRGPCSSRTAGSRRAPRRLTRALSPRRPLPLRPLLPLPASSPSCPRSCTPRTTSGCGAGCA